MDCHPTEQYLEECNQYSNVRPYCPATGFSSPRGWTTFPHFVSIANGTSGCSLAVAGLTRAWDPFATHCNSESQQSAPDVSYSLPLAARLVNMFLSVSGDCAADLD
jgi:hypothetical protein